MKSFLVLLSLLCLSIWQTHAAHHAILVAGSTYFWNYRHQADVFHAYQILIKYGVPAENIITFAYDDVVTDPENPIPGKIFNKPSTGQGDDVYQGVVIDYKGDDVTPANFLSVLRGDPLAVQGKKVLKSTEEDFVFVYFADHGGEGFIAFPDEYLYADDFVDALNYMSDKKMYQQMVVYIEACESGSMFEGLLPTNINIYAATAAKSNQNSFATYCNPNNTVNGVSLKTCIGDQFSVNFLENLETVDPSTETLEEQYNIVFQETTKSSVQQFGDLSLTSQPIGNFEANGASYAPLVSKSLDNFAKSADVDSRLVKLYYLNQRHQDLGSTETEQALNEEIDSIMRFDSIFTYLSEKFNLNVNAPVKNINFPCLKDRMVIYEALCGKLSDYGLQYARYIYYTCSQGVDTYDYEDALLQQCS